GDFSPEIFMRSLIVAAIALSVLAAPAFAAKSAGNDAMKSCAASWQAMSAADKAKTTYKAYSTDCMKNGGPNAPPRPPPPYMAANARGRFFEPDDGRQARRRHRRVQGWQLYMAKNHTGAC